MEAHEQKGKKSKETGTSAPSNKIAPRQTSGQGRWRGLETSQTAADGGGATGSRGVRGLRVTRPSKRSRACKRLQIVRGETKQVARTS